MTHSALPPSVPVRTPWARPWTWGLITAAALILSVHVACGGSSNTTPTNTTPPPPATYTISGNAGRAGVTLSYNDGGAKTLTSGADGAFSFTITSGWSGTLTPSLTGYSFTPASRSFTNVTSSQTGQSFTANALTFTISGQTAVAGVTLSYTDGTAKTVVSDGTGRFSFTVPYNWSGTLTPAKPGYTFTPANRTFTSVIADSANQDFTAQALQLTLSGTAGIAGATLSYVDGTPKTVTADAQGFFTIAVPYGWAGTLTPSKAAYAPNLPAYTFSPASITFPALTAHQLNIAFSASSVPRFGVVVFSNGWIGIVDPATQTMSTCLLNEDMLDASSSTFDVAITPDGTTVLVSSFADDLVNIIDVRDISNPRLLTRINVGFFAEDLDITPDGRFALVTDGGFSTHIAVIDIQNRRLADAYDPFQSQTHPMMCSIAISPDGQNVLAVDYFSGLIQAFTIDANGHLTYIKEFQTPLKGSAAIFRPVNIAFSPDGKTAIAVGCLSSYDSHSNLIYEDMIWPVLKLSGPGQVEVTSYVKPTFRVGASQSVVFSPDGTKAYISCVRDVNDPKYPKQAIQVLDITGAGVATPVGLPLDLDFVGTSQLFGVDTMAIEPSGRFLYVSNMTLSGAKSMIQVVDTQTGQVSTSIPTPPVQLSFKSGLATKDAYPTGIAFTKK